MKGSYKSLFGISLKDAKVLCIEKFGKLPRMGYETVLYQDWQNWSDNSASLRTIILQNKSGKFSLYAYLSPSIY